MSQEWKLVPVVPTEEMLNVLHDRVLISVNARKQEANILNDKAWWAAVVTAAPVPPAVKQSASTTQACDHLWTDDGEFAYCCTVCGLHIDTSASDAVLQEANQAAFEAGGTEDGGYELSGDEFDAIVAEAASSAVFEYVIRTTSITAHEPPAGDEVDNSPDGVKLEVFQIVCKERDRLQAENAALQQRLNVADQQVDDLKKDKERLDSLEANFWDVRHHSSALGDTGDYTSCVEIVGHWMDKPLERVIGEDYNENLRAAIDQAMKADAYPPARPEHPEIDAALGDEDWHMNPCKQGHRDVGACGGKAFCHTCDETITAATTQEAFEQWNATHPATPQ